MSRLFITLFCCMLPATSMALTMAEQQQVIYLDNPQLANAAGKASSELSLAIFEDQQFKPIPFQIDEYDEFGLVWFTNSGNQMVGKPEIFDGDDKILMMLKDTGNQKAHEQKPAEGKILSEITFNTSAGIRYVYLLENNTQRSDIEYVQHSIETGETFTDHYVLKTDPQNELNWLYLNSKANYDKGLPTTIDTFKVQFRGGFITSWPQVTLTNKNLRPEITGFKSGPIRTITQLKASLVIAKVPVISQQMQAHRFSSHFEAHSHNSIPAIFRKTVAKPSIRISLDGHNQYGGQVSTALWREPTQVDGKLNDDEKSMIDSGISMKDNWILFRNPDDMYLMTFFEVPQSMAHLPLELIYEDDPKLKIKPERYPGQLPNVGYQLKGMPDVDELDFRFTMLFMSAPNAEEVTQFAEQIHHSTDFSVDSASQLAHTGELAP